MPHKRSSTTSPNSEAAGASSDEAFRAAQKAERDCWRRDAQKYAGVYQREREAMRRQEPPDDPAEALLWYEIAEEKRLRWLGVPAGADPVQVMAYLEELAAESEAGQEEEHGGESDSLVGEK